MLAEGRGHRPGELTYQVAATFDLYSSGPASDRPFDRGLITGAKGLGWGTLVDSPGRLFVAGACCQPWLGQVTFHPLVGETFSPFGDPGQVKIAWTLETIPDTATSCVLRTETRVLATDPVARKQFRRYWRWARFGIFTIRWLLLPAVRRQAEQQARSGTRTAV